MSEVAECLSRVKLGEAQSFLNLTLFPLTVKDPAEATYRLLDEALELGCARIAEVSEAGSVPELELINECDRPVLLVDGEELVGAKQNRILNTTVLIGGHERLVIPVSCVEAGRGHHESDEFVTVRRSFYAGGRARKAAQVTESLRSTGSHHSNQGQIWDDIARKAARMDSYSETGAAAALYETHRERLGEFEKAFSPVTDQVGALFAVNGAVLGFDLFDSATTLTGFLPKLVQSYGLDAVDLGGRATSRSVAPEIAKGFLEETAAAPYEWFPAVGLGDELRLEASELAGAALVADERVVHLCAFPVQRQRTTGSGSDVIDLTMARPSVRRRFRRAA